MKKSFKSIISFAAIILLLVLITTCFTISMVIIQEYAKEDCYSNIEETTKQLSNMFNHTMRQSREQLEMFSDLLVASEINTDEQLLSYMKNFCKTQMFSGVCIHRANGSSLYHNYHPHNSGSSYSFAIEEKKAPYVSNVYSNGESRSQKYVYQAIPVKSGNETVAILYGYISLDNFPNFVSTTEYGGKCQYYIIDGKGNFLMDEYHRVDKDLNEIPLGSISSIPERAVKDGYSIKTLQSDIARGESGYFIFRSNETQEWCYTYYMPIGINNWMMQITIDENIAFETYYAIRSTIVILMVVAIFLMMLIILLIMLQSFLRRKTDERNLARADYQNAVQSALINAHNNPYFVDRALEIIGKQIKAETVLLLTFNDRVVTQAQYWPSQDKSQAMALMGINIRDSFPNLFDVLVARQSIIYDSQEAGFEVSESAAAILKSLEVSNMMLAPINDNSGLLKGTIAAVNVPKEERRTELLECVSRDFFMAITNLENHNIIKKMGEIDYLTGLKNRNSFESDLPDYEVLNADNLWFIFVDANGLHELNNTKGHKAGDLMLCTVADTMKKIFGADSTYRLGGDEFVAFAADSTHEELMSRKYRLMDELNKKGYSVSAGFDGAEKNENRVFDVESLVAAAEKMMYKNKREYYEANDIKSERYRSETHSAFSN